MGERRDHFTEELEAVERGLRTLDQIEDPDLRDAVRAALGFRAATPGLDTSRRARIRRRVLAVAPRGPRLSDRAYAALAVLGSPIPYAVRAFGLVLLAGAILASATVASADSLPDEPLYGLKSAAEDARLALASTPEDRAAVQLSLAEHRLGEAQRFAERGWDSQTLIATSVYGSHLANAAAELAQVEQLSPGAAALVRQLEARLADQQHRASETAKRLLADPDTALSGVVLSSVLATVDDDAATPAARIAMSAAAVAEHLAAIAQERVAGGEPLRDALPGVQRTFGVATDEEQVDAAAADADAVADEVVDEVLAEEGGVAPAAISTAPTAEGTAKAAATSAPRVTSPLAVGSTARDVPTSTATPRAARTPSLRRTPTPRPTARVAPTPDPSARAAADKAKQAAASARDAATKAKQATKRTPTPRPTPR